MTKNPKIVIQCAGRKNSVQPGQGLRTNENQIIKFVSHPALAPRDGLYYAHPDDRNSDGGTWRNYIVKYNREGGELNRLGLLPAYQLYANEIYRSLVNKFGIDRVFILSAGWGLIAANFLTPDYDITFSNSASDFVRRSSTDSFFDLCLLPDDGEDTVFLGGQSYLGLFQSLTAGFAGSKLVFYNSDSEPKLKPGFRLKSFRVAQRTNWHYTCAQMLIENGIPE